MPRPSSRRPRADSPLPSANKPASGGTTSTAEHSNSRPPKSAKRGRSCEPVLRQESPWTPRSPTTSNFGKTMTTMLGEMRTRRMMRWTWTTSTASCRELLVCISWVVLGALNLEMLMLLPSIDPRILVTTSRDPSSKLMSFSKEMRLLFPTGIRLNRGNLVLPELVSAAQRERLTDVVLLHEHR